MNQNVLVEEREVGIGRQRKQEGSPDRTASPGAEGLSGSRSGRLLEAF